MPVDLTIVIITFNRYSYLLRLLNFYKDYDFHPKILILDSSDHEPVDGELLCLLDSSNILWKRYDPEIFFTSKIADGLQYIKTEYVVLAADDDFLFPGALEKCIEFMRLNPAYSSCHGLYYLHFPMSNLGYKSIGLAPLYEAGTFLGGDVSWKKRVNNYLCGTYAYYPLYAVHRVFEFKRIWKHADKCVFDWGLSELVPCVLSLIIGKMCVLEMPYASREPNSYTWFDDRRHREMYSMEKIVLASHEIAIFLSENQGENYEECCNFLSQSFNDYVSRALSKRSPYISFFNKLRIFLKIKLRVKSKYSSSILGHENYRALQKALFASKTSAKEINSSRAKYSFISNKG